MSAKSILTASLLAASAIFISACKTENPAYSYDDSRNPYFQKAETAASEHNTDAAIAAYEEALQHKPGLAEAHRQLGLLYSEQKHDSIRALYHFNQYLELRPTGEQRESVQKLMDREALTFAAALAHSPVQNAEVVAAIQSENTAIKQQLQASLKTTAELEKALDVQKQKDAASNVDGSAGTQPASTSLATTASGSGTEAAPAPLSQKNTVATQPTSSVASTASARTYTIKSGDSLWKISSQFYHGDVKNGVEKIKQANASVLADGKPLKIGTVLTIP